MEEKNIQEQILNLDQKLDRLLEFVEQQNRKREEFDDLVTDVSIVAKDAFKNSVVMLDKAQVELDSCGISCLIIKILQNLDTFHEMLDMMESARDFMKDVTPILHQVGLDAVNKMNELDQKGYFEYIRQLMHFLEKWVQVFTVEDLKRVEDNLESIAGILRNFSDPALLAVMNKATRAMTEVKMEDDTKIPSLWQIFRQLRSKEVRKTISYSLRVVKEVAIASSPHSSQ
jgi:uncharacterized protein YjgD (DUF1641 family)